MEWIYSLTIIELLKEYGSLLRRSEQAQAESWYSQKIEEMKENYKPPQVMDSKGRPVNTSTVNQDRLLNSEKESYFEGLLPEELRNDTE